MIMPPVHMPPGQGPGIRMPSESARLTASSIMTDSDRRTRDIGVTERPVAQALVPARLHDYDRVPARASHWQDDRGRRSLGAPSRRPGWPGPRDPQLDS